LSECSLSAQALDVINPANLPYKPTSKKLIFGCLIGNVLEWFDFAIYGYLASLFSILFFPNLDPNTALLSSYGVFAISFIMRPIGAILFGHLGDKWGRKLAFQWSLACMAIPTLLIGFLPIYAQIGIWAPICLILARMVQGLSVGGEFSGSIILLTEHAPFNKKGFFSAWADIGSAIGMISAALVVFILKALLTEVDLMAWGWRLPFIAGFLFAIFGYFLRERLLTETPEFLEQKNISLRHSKNHSSNWPLREIFKNHKKTLFWATNFLMINSAGYYLLIIFIPNQNLSNVSGIYGSASILWNLIIMIPAIFWGAILSDRIGQVRCLVMGHLGCVIMTPVVLYTAKYGEFSHQLICESLFSFCLGFCFGPRSSFMAEIFPTAIRYSAVSLSYNLGNAIFGGTAPLICALMIEQTGWLMAPAFYIAIASLVSLTATFLLSAYRPWSFHSPYLGAVNLLK
jgi:MFS transporter, MHS family, proline/betaine transporter